MATRRKPYIREVDGCWWLRRPFYRFYMLRESTSLFAVWVSLYLLLGLLCPSTFLKLLNNPIVVLLNLVALAAAVLHTWTWFGLVPKALNLPEACLGKIVKGLWWTTAAVSVIFLLLAIF